MPAPLDLTGQNLRTTYQRVVQVQGTELYDGLGNPIFDLTTGGGGGGGGLTIANYIPKERITPNGTSASYSLVNTPVSGTEHVFVNGILNEVTDDYTISGPTITFLLIPLVTDKILVTYFK